MLPHFGLFLFGFLFGLKHAFDADHLAAMSVINAESKNTAHRAMQSGLSWGLGHTLILLAAGFVMVFFDVHFSQTISDTFEKAVALMLIYFGLRALTRFIVERKERGDFNVHTHPPFGEHAHPKKSFFVGALHGLAGSAALITLLLATIDSSFIAMLFIGIFGLGSILGMMAITFFIGAFSQFMEARHLHIQKTLGVLAGVFSIFVGGQILL